MADTTNIVARPYTLPVYLERKQMDRNQQGHGDLCGHDRPANGGRYAAHALADRLDGISPSATLALSAQAAALKAQGRDIINMGVGEPDFETPELVRIAAQDA